MTKYEKLKKYQLENHNNYPHKYPKEVDEYALNTLSPKNNTSKILYWVIYWPASLSAYILGDFALDLIMKIGGKTYGYFYKKILSDAQKSE
jgi:hypothetical protein